MDSVFLAEKRCKYQLVLCTLISYANQLSIWWITAALHRGCWQQYQLYESKRLCFCFCILHCKYGAMHFMLYFPKPYKQCTTLKTIFTYSFQVRNPMLYRPRYPNQRCYLHWKRHLGSWFLYAQAFGLRVQTELHCRSSMAKWNLLLWPRSHWWGGKSKPNFKYHFGLHLWTTYDHNYHYYDN